MGRDDVPEVAGRAPIRGVDEVLAAARAGVHRPGPLELLAATQRGALVIDTRTEKQRREDGELPGALVIDRTVLEWRLDPGSDHRIPEAVDHDVEVIVVCSQGYSSGLAPRVFGCSACGGQRTWRAASRRTGPQGWPQGCLSVTALPTSAPERSGLDWTLARQVV